MGAERPKAFVELGGQALVWRAARAFESAPSVGGIVAVVPETEVDRARALLASVNGLLAVVAGGARRQDSVLEGLKQVPDEFEGVVLVHDAARPLVDPLPGVEVVVRSDQQTRWDFPSAVELYRQPSASRATQTVHRFALVAGIT